MGDPGDEDKVFGVVHRVDDAVIANADAEVVPPGELHRAWCTRVNREVIDCGRNTIGNRSTEPAWAGRLASKGAVEPRMKAVVYDRYGPPEVLRLEDVARPVPKADEVLVRVHATTVTRTDCGWRDPRPYVFVRFFIGILKPRRRILGMELAGEVVATGARVAELKVGDQVFGISGFGAHAEFVCVRENAPLEHKPVGVPFDQAAPVCDGGCTALSCLRQVDLRAGQRILIYGASGSIGTAAVQVAKHLGAEVTAVCSAESVELVKSLGADEVIDYKHEDFTKNGKTYEIIFDAVGKHSFRRCRRSLKSGGTYVSTDLGFMWHLPILMAWTHWIGDKRAKLGIARYTKQDVVLLKELVQNGAYRAVIDRSYPLDRVVDAVRYVETGQKIGSVVLTVGPS
jgi:NADPH:quinone reductase-like Zn-dependent oxidoreductase